MKERNYCYEYNGGYCSSPLAITFKELDYAPKLEKLYYLLHWPIPTEILRPHIPSTLEIDTFNGSAWLGVVVFVIEGIYPRGLSSISLTPAFPEINVRTYVHYRW